MIVYHLCIETVDADGMRYGKRFDAFEAELDADGIRQWNGLSETRGFYSAYQKECRL